MRKTINEHTHGKQLQRYSAFVHKSWPQPYCDDWAGKNNQHQANGGYEKKNVSNRLRVKRLEVPYTLHTQPTADGVDRGHQTGWDQPQLGYCFKGSSVVADHGDR